MCCRYWADDSPEIREIVEEMNRAPLLGRWKGVAEAGNRASLVGKCRDAALEDPRVATTGNRTSLAGKCRAPVKIVISGEVRPTNVVPVLAPDRFGRRAVFPMQWGYSGRSLLINARSETAATKPTFREDWRRHRCIVPASRYFEWEHICREDGKKRVGSKYKIWAKDESVTWLCGLYRLEGGLPVFVVLTRETAEEIRFLHDRMPLILPGERIDDWLRPEGDPEKLLHEKCPPVAFAKETDGPSPDWEQGKWEVAYNSKTNSNPIVM